MQRHNLRQIEKPFQPQFGNKKKHAEKKAIQCGNPVFGPFLKLVFSDFAIVLSLSTSEFFKSHNSSLSTVVIQHNGSLKLFKIILIIIFNAEVDAIVVGFNDMALSWYHGRRWSRLIRVVRSMPLTQGPRHILT